MYLLVWIILLWSSYSVVQYTELLYRIPLSNQRGAFHFLFFPSLYFRPKEHSCAYTSQYYSLMYTWVKNVLSMHLEKKQKQEQKNFQQEIIMIQQCLQACLHMHSKNKISSKTTGWLLLSHYIIICQDIILLSFLLHVEGSISWNYFWKL